MPFMRQYVALKGLCLACNFPGFASIPGAYAVGYIRSSLHG
jgi:hypothetical protein